jgi:hypothetical protein
MMTPTVAWEVKAALLGARTPEEVLEAAVVEAPRVRRVLRAPRARVEWPPAARAGRLGPVAARRAAQRQAQGAAELVGPEALVGVSQMRAGVVKKTC